jgi:DNA-binding FadR family transcriptional regulator
MIIEAPLAGLNRVVRRTAAQDCARQLLDLVRSGAIPPDSRLPTEKQLCDQLGVGRSTVREALQILATLNVVRAVPGSGTYARLPSADQAVRADLLAGLIGNEAAFDLLEARAMIEPAAARLACLRATEAELAALGALLDRHQAACDAGQPVASFAARFHMLLAAASGNRAITAFMESIMGLLEARGQWLCGGSDEARRELAEHRAILALVCARDAEGTADALARHIVDYAAFYDVAAPGIAAVAGMRAA